MDSSVELPGASLFPQKVFICFLERFLEITSKSKYCLVQILSLVLDSVTHLRDRIRS